MDRQTDTTKRIISPVSRLTINYERSLRGGDMSYGKRSHIAEILTILNDALEDLKDNNCFSD